MARAGERRCSGDVDRTRSKHFAGSADPAREFGQRHQNPLKASSEMQITAVSEPHSTVVSADDGRRLSGMPLDGFSGCEGEPVVHEPVSGSQSPQRRRAHEIEDPLPALCGF